MEASFTESGSVLQDVVNELGRRLDYKVVNGRYQGTPNTIGFDGTWASPEGHTLVVEVKTTDAYRISLDTIARYRNRLIDSNDISGPSSILIVVGREDTGELEAQVRGSRHAWDIRLISADALLKLVRVKESTDASDTGRKIRGLLVPKEYTRLDDMIDIVFATATDVEAAIMSEAVAEQDETSEVSIAGDRKGFDFTDAAVLQAKRAQIVSALERDQNVKLVKRSRALYWDSAHSTRAAITISKRYKRSATYAYWYAYHPQWDEFLAESQHGFLTLGCIDMNIAFVIPRHVLHHHLNSLNTTRTERSTYWHLHIGETPQHSFELLLPREEKNLRLDAYTIRLPEAHEQ